MKKLLNAIGTAFRWIWKSISFTRQLVLNLIFLIAVFAVIYFVGFDHSHQPHMQPPTPRALLVDIDSTIVEKAREIDPYDITSYNLLGQPVEPETVLYDLVTQIREAAKDPSINGLVLELQRMPETNLTKLRYIAKALNEFKATKKPIIAIGPYYSQSQYYLASYADEIYMAADGAVTLDGYAAYTLYFKELLDKLDITMHVFRVGTYKSAVEPFTRANMSPEAREANAVWLNQLWSAYIDDVSTNRDVSADAISPKSEQLLDELRKANGNLAQLVKTLGLVDTLSTREEINAKLIERFGKQGQDDYQHVSIYQYDSPTMPTPEQSQLAVVVISGAIIDGESREGNTGGDTIAQQLREARLNNKIKSVILRIDSPGGSATASEVIRNEVIALKKAGKPVIASMSSYAASGGYWVAADADRIIAQPTTITGSIGIFGLVPTFEDALAKYGVYSDGIGTTSIAGFSPLRALSPTLNEVIQLTIENGYSRFINLVANGRKMPVADVEKIAQGRVWTGSDALRLGLVDKIGDFDTAIDEAAKLANIKAHSLNWMKQPLSPMQQLISDVINQLGVKVNAYFAPNIELPKPLETVINTASEYQIFSEFNDPKGQYVWCLACNVEQP